MTMYLYLTGFRFLKFGYAAAIGYALALIILVLTLIQLRILGVFRED
jgi:ABC-type sugar transport system permease subunit